VQEVDQVEGADILLLGRISKSWKGAEETEYKVRSRNKGFTRLRDLKSQKLPQ